VPSLPTVPDKTERKGEKIDIWCDAEQAQVFDPSSGGNLTA